MHTRAGHTRVVMTPTVVTTCPTARAAATCVTMEHARTAAMTATAFEEPAALGEYDLAQSRTPAHWSRK
jgi:hypothetical protein